MIRAFQWDLARQVERLDVLKKLLPRYAEWGYQELYLHLEDAVEYPSLPEIARRDAYTHRQFAELVATATHVGIKVVPIVNLLGHTQYLIKTPELRDLNELRAPDGSPLEHGQLCPLHPRTLEVAEKLLRDMAPFCTAGKVHVGLDESFQIGKCPRCREEIARSGLAQHFAGHVGRLHTIARFLGLRMGIWADMLNFIPEAIPLLPASVIAYDWYYYSFRKHPRVELFNFAESDLATPLRARGIEYWGCPMNGAFRYEPLPIFSDRLANLRSWWQRCQKTKAAGFLVTSWESYRLALEATTIVDAAAASLWLEGAPDNDFDWLSKGFARVFGKTGARSAAKAALACDKYPFSGYARWEINDRWDVVASPKADKKFAQEKPTPGALEKRITGSRVRGAHASRVLAWASRPGPSIRSRRDTESNTRDAYAPRTDCKRTTIPIQSEANFRAFYPSQEKYFSRIARLKLPAPLAASVAFRRYLAQRDVFVREGAQGVFALRKVRSKRRVKDNTSHIKLLTRLETDARVFSTALSAGRKAARAMWRRTRDPKIHGQNETMLDADATRLRAWRYWLRTVRLAPEKIFAATPVCGAWQLHFVVHNFAPALQNVVVEQQLHDGEWRALHRRHTIEFQTSAAKPRTDIRRPFSVPVGSPNDVLRISLRGLGQVAIELIELTNGVETLAPAVARKRTILGQPAPRGGFPDIAPMPGEESILSLTFTRRLA